VYEVVPRQGQLRDDVLLGDVREHPDLSKRDRSPITVAMLEALSCGQRGPGRHQGVRPK